MKEEILKAYTGFCQLYGRDFSKDGLSIWVSVLGDLSIDQLRMAVQFYAKDPELSRFFPQPGQLYGLANPKENKEEKASNVVDNIFQALRSYGTDKYNENRAKLKIGPIGWKWIEQQGGWQVWVPTVTSEEMVPTLKSQARKSIMGLIQTETNLQITGQARTQTLNDLGVKMKELCKET
jgi:hypothetical protein